MGEAIADVVEPVAGLVMDAWERLRDPARLVDVYRRRARRKQNRAGRLRRRAARARDRGWWVLWKERSRRAEELMRQSEQLRADADQLARDTAGKL